jgi:fructose-bisphosphate aldolase/2-amino-3,7-dideoxy-D-threo-hept-6-ulosonate synthase
VIELDKTMTGKEIRLGRIRDDESGNFVTVPMDHGVTMGPVEGLNDVHETIDAVGRGGGDSVLVHKGVVEHAFDRVQEEVGVIVHLNAATTVGPDPNDKVVVGDVKRAVRLGADAVSVHINVGSETEPHQLQDLGRVADECDEYGMPLLAMTYVRGPDVEPTAENVAHATRLGAELGADVVKTSYTGDPDGYERVIDGCPVPVVIAGGPKAETEREVLRDVRDAMDIGARGVAMGRNVFQQGDVEAMTRAVSRVVHEGVSVDEALSEVRA